MKSIIRSLFIAIAILSTFPSLESAKILGYFVSVSRSHFIIHDSLLRGLAAKGHDVSKTKNYIIHPRVIHLSFLHR